MIRAMSTELFLDFLGIRMDSKAAEKAGLDFSMNLITPDNGEKFAIELSNATLTNVEGYLVNDPDLTITINRADLEQTMAGVKSMEAQIVDGKAKIEGDASILGKLAAVMVDFEMGFEIIGISLDRDRQALDTFLEGNELPWDIERLHFRCSGIRSV